MTAVKEKDRHIKSEDKDNLERPSLVTDLLQNHHIRTLYNVVIVILLTFIINASVSSYFLGKNFSKALGIELIILGFRNLDLALLGWIGSYSLIVSAYFFCKLWASKKTSRARTPKYWDLFWVTALITIYYPMIFIHSSYLVYRFDLGVGSSGFLIGENARLFMKIHSFIANVASNVSSYKPNSEQNFPFPKLSHFILYTFMPTLIYKDYYPRTKSIRWSFVLCWILEICGALWLVSFGVENYVNPSLENFGTRKYSLGEIFVYIFEIAPASVLIFESIYFLVMHSWQNLFAEITRFSNRNFYGAWWHSTDFSTYFRTWNIIVQEWLFLHVFKIISKILPLNLAKLFLFVISATVHEWLIICMFKFVLPLNFLQFVFFGYILLFVRTPKNALFNTLFLYGLLLGQGILTTMFTVEFYARRNSPIQNPSILDYVKPRFLTFISD